jgi:hypothetical protein
MFKVIKSKNLGRSGHTIKVRGEKVCIPAFLKPNSDGSISKEVLETSKMNMLWHVMERVRKNYGRRFTHDIMNQYVKEWVDNEALIEIHFRDGQVGIAHLGPDE